MGGIVIWNMEYFMDPLKQQKIIKTNNNFLHFVIHKVFVIAVESSTTLLKRYSPKSPKMNSENNSVSTNICNEHLVFMTRTERAFQFNSNVCC